MRSILLNLTKSVCVCVMAAAIFTTSTVLASPIRAFHQQQDQSKDNGKQQPAASDAEQKAVAKIQAATDVPSKITAAGEFIKKYPKSTLRPNVIGHIAQEINKSDNNAQRITQFESMLTVFKENSDGEVIMPILVDLYFKDNRPDDGFRVATAYLAKNPNDVAVLTQASLEGVERAKKREAKYVQQSTQFGAKAIEVIESNKKPESYDDAKWNEYRTRWLPTLYQSMGLLSMMTGNKADAKAKLDKAATINPKDPFTYVLLGSILNDEYQQLAEQHKAAGAGPLKDQLLKQAHAKLDEVIDMFAHAVGLAEGNTAYQSLHDQILQDLQSYYKYRHGGSSDGLQQMIDKYKTP